MNKLHVYYRISSNSYNKPKLCDKQTSLNNFLHHFPVDEITVLVDRVDPELQAYLDKLTSYIGLKQERIDGGSSAQSFRIAYEKALELPNDAWVLLQEDDFLHTNGARECLLEGLNCAPYLSLTDYPDKYVPAGQRIDGVWGNPLVPEDGAESTKVFYTKSTHWRYVNSTTCTFASHVHILREDYPIWKRHCFATPDVTHPNDFPCFIDLYNHGRYLISPLPTKATHAEPPWIAPLVDWQKELQK